jgi:hypothetical protein
MVLFVSRLLLIGPTGLPELSNEALWHLRTSANDHLEQALSISFDPSPTPPEVHDVALYFLMQENARVEQWCLEQPDSAWFTPCREFVTLLVGVICSNPESAVLGRIIQAVATKDCSENVLGLIIAVLYLRETPVKPEHIAPAIAICWRACKYICFSQIEHRLCLAFLSRWLAGTPVGERNAMWLELHP